MIASAATQRTQEIGVRLALGAKRLKVISLVLAQTMRLCGIGIAIGIPATLLAARTLRALLFRVSVTDAVVVLAAAEILIAVAPKLDALTALRYE